MLIGIDVGGTYTDGIAVSEQGDVLQLAKYPTCRESVLDSLTGCLDSLLGGLNPRSVSRVAISTTLLTNAILQGDLDKTALMVMPGLGIEHSCLSFGVEPIVLPGAIDFRGREISPPDLNLIAKLAQELSTNGYQTVALAGKFAQRNNSHELAAEKTIREHCPSLQVESSHRYYGSLNFPRRATTAYLAAATRSKYRTFLSDLAAALKARQLAAPVFVLKTDGGTLPLEAALERPLETIYSGPAASVLGVTALVPPDATAVVLDIGGTTTDLGLILSGEPLMAEYGAEIGPFKTLVRSFAVSSTAVGGDTPVEVIGGRLGLGTRRKGPAFCLGGQDATVTDALRFLKLSDHGSAELARTALERIAAVVGIQPVEAAEIIVNQVVDRICAAFKLMVKRWENEPAYRVWEVLHPNRIGRFKILGVGGGAQGLTKLVAERLDCDWVVPRIGKVANALGAALARPTFSISLHADTARKSYCIAETGAQLPWPRGKSELELARDIAHKHFRQRAWELGLAEADGEITREDVFNVVRGFETEGKIIELCMEVKTGVLMRARGG